MAARQHRTMRSNRIASLPYPPPPQVIKGEEEPPNPPAPNFVEIAPAVNDNLSTDEADTIDLPSKQGKFGWSLVGQEYLPYITRGEQKYCAVRIIESHVLNKHFGILHADLYSCTTVRSYYITQFESELLTSINYEHCEGRYGLEKFTLKDLIVKLEDVKQFYTFLDFCYNKLLNPRSGPNAPCGFICINGKSIIAYTRKDGEKYIPLFYFEGICNNLEMNSKTLDTWELAYLKFCCKIQGIKKDFLDNNSCAAVKFDDVKGYFPEGTRFRDVWLQKQADAYILGDGVDDD